MSARFVVHVVISGGSVADDIYVGPFRAEDQAEAKAKAIERRAPHVMTMVRELHPGRTSLGFLADEIGE